MKAMIDFHIHSYFSDSDQTPQEILTVLREYVDEIRYFRYVDYKVKNSIENIKKNQCLYLFRKKMKSFIFLRRR